MTEGHRIRKNASRTLPLRLTYSSGEKADVLLRAELVVAVVLGQQLTQEAQIAANLITRLGLLTNRWADEAEADTYSFKYVQSTECYPSAIRFLFDKVLGSSGER